MKKELFELYLQNLEKSIDLIDVIIQVVQSYEGKPHYEYERELEDVVNKTICTHDGVDTIKTVEFSLKHINDRYDVKLLFWNGVGEQFREVSLAGDTYVYKEEMVPAMKRQQENLKKQIESLKLEALKLDEYRKKLEALRKEAEELKEEIPLIIRESFDLKTFIWI